MSGGRVPITIAALSAAAFFIGAVGVLVAAFGVGAVLAACVAALEEAATGTTSMVEPTEFGLTGGVIFFLGILIITVAGGIWEEIQ